MKNTPPLIIAEVAQSHDGSLGTAHAFIDAVSSTGADAIKFQTHIAQAETTPHEPWRIKFSSQDKSRFDYWKRMEFTKKQWKELKIHTDDVGLKFMSSPFSIEAVHLLRDIGVYAWKIASGELNSDEILECISETNKEIFISTGMSTIKEIDNSVKKIKMKGLPLTVMQCTSMYPTPPEKIGLNMLEFFKKKYNCGVGLSDHSGTIYPGLAAVTIGIDVLEVHVTLSKNMFGPDVSSSINIEELKQLVEGSKFITNCLNQEVDKDSIAKELEPIAKIFRKSIVYNKDLPKGYILTREDFSFKKPGTGIQPHKIINVVGKKLSKAVRMDDLTSIKDFM